MPSGEIHNKIEAYPKNKSSYRRLRRNHKHTLKYFVPSGLMYEEVSTSWCILSRLLATRTIIILSASPLWASHFGDYEHPRIWADRVVNKWEVTYIRDVARHIWPIGGKITYMHLWALINMSRHVSPSRYCLINID